MERTLFKDVLFQG